MGYLCRQSELSLMSSISCPGILVQVQSGLRAAAMVEAINDAYSRRVVARSAMIAAEIGLMLRSRELDGGSEEISSRNRRPAAVACPLPRPSSV